MVLWLVCDASGSMIEGGKRFIIRGLVRQVEQHFRLGYAAMPDLRLVAWRDQSSQVAWQPGDEVPGELLDSQGSADAVGLLTMLGQDDSDRYLLLTDGFWSDDSRRAIKRWRDTLPPNALRIIKVGADANPKLIGDGVFEAEQFLEAMDGWFA